MRRAVSSTHREVLVLAFAVMSGVNLKAGSGETD